MASSMSPLALVHRVLDVALVVLVVLGVTTVVTTRLLPLTGHGTLVVTGSSMEPTIPLGAAVVTEAVSPGELRVGDVVSLATGSTLQTVFTHRVTRLITRSDGLWIETKGDANKSADPVITPTSDVLGRVVVEIPGAGYLLRFLALPSGLAAATCLASLLIVLSSFIDSVDRDRRSRNRSVAMDPRPARPDETVEPGPAETLPNVTTTRARRASKQRIRYALVPRSAAALGAPAR